jgi:hypothetical protein
MALLVAHTVSSCSFIKSRSRQHVIGDWMSPRRFPQKAMPAQIASMLCKDLRLLDNCPRRASVILRWASADCCPYVRADHGMVATGQ